MSGGVSVCAARACGVIVCVYVKPFRIFGLKGVTSDDLKAGSFEITVFGSYDSGDEWM